MYEKIEAVEDAEDDECEGTKIGIKSWLHNNQTFSYGVWDKFDTLSSQYDIKKSII
jgi:hypothetical protein